MNLLLDTHAMLWWSLNDSRLPVKAHALIADDANTVYFSLASVWEAAIKFGIGKLPEAGNFIADLREGRAMPGFVELAITAQHAIRAGTLDIDHKDPFDRMLIAQAQAEGLTLISNERLFDSFDVSRIWS